MGNVCEAQEAPDAAPPETAPAPPKFDGAFAGEIQARAVRMSGISPGDRLIEVSGQDVSSWTFAKVGQLLQQFRKMPESAVRDIVVVFQKPDGSVVKHVYDRHTILKDGFGMSLGKTGSFAAVKRSSDRDRLVYFLGIHEPLSVPKVRAIELPRSNASVSLVAKFHMSVPQIDEMLASYRGREHALFEVLERKYSQPVPINIEADKALQNDLQKMQELQELDAIMRMTGQKQDNAPPAGSNPSAGQF